MSRDVLESILEDIQKCIEIVQHRFAKITSSADFSKDDDCVQVLDSIAMRIQAIGDLVKVGIKNNKNFFDSYPEIHWSDIIKTRDKISHHYTELDPEVIYFICKAMETKHQCKK